MASQNSELIPPPNRDGTRQSGGKTIAVGLIIVVSALLLWAYVAARPAMPRSLLRQLRPGMSKVEVVEILGKPNDTDNDRWIYSRWGNIGCAGRRAPRDRANDRRIRTHQAGHLSPTR